MKTRHLIVGCISLLTASGALADLVQYTASPGSFPNVTNALNAEFGTASFPPLVETGLSYYSVNGVGPATLNLRFKQDFGGFLFNFGFYNVTPALLAIDTSTDAGKIAYATAALAPGNASVIFNDSTQNPGATATVSANGGDLLGFFLIPDNTLANFQTNQASFGLTGLQDSIFGQPPPLRWPFFGDAAANPGGFDQLMSFSGTSSVTGLQTSMFAWEDLTRLPGLPVGSDNSFSDLIFTVDGVSSAVPEPATLAFVFALLGACGLSRSRPSQRKAQS